MTTHLRTKPDAGEAPEVDAREPVARLLRDLRTGVTGLTAREAARRLQVSGPNVLPSHHGATWPLALLRQLIHPLALLLWVAAGLAWLAGTTNLAIAIVGVILLNGLLAFVQEQQAEKAVEALGRYLPDRASVLRDGSVRHVPATEIVPGDVLVLAEGDRVPADARLVEGTLDVDASMLTGESAAVTRMADVHDDASRPLESPVLVFSGTVCVAGAAHAVVHATGRHTEIGRIASLSARVGREESPLERQVRRVAWLIAGVAVVVGIGFLPLGWLAGLSWSAAFVFAIGLLVANVPEGLLPTITLALAAGVRSMAKEGALVKRLSAVETLGSTTVICTDKTGTLTRNSMHVEEVRDGLGEPLSDVGVLAASLARCSTADLASASGDPTELALLGYAADHGTALDPAARETARETLYSFDPRLKRMSTVDSVDGVLFVATKGCAGTGGAAVRVGPRRFRHRSPAHDRATGADHRARRRDGGPRPASAGRRPPRGGRRAGEPRRSRVGPVPAGAGRARRPAAARGRRRGRGLPFGGHHRPRRDRRQRPDRGGDRAPRRDRRGPRDQW